MNPTTEAGRALLYGKTVMDAASRNTDPTGFRNAFAADIIAIEREAYAKVRAAVNEHADIRLPDGRLAIAREVAVLLIDTLMGDDDGR